MGCSSSCSCPCSDTGPPSPAKSSSIKTSRSSRFVEPRSTSKNFLQTRNPQCSASVGTTMDRQSDVTSDQEVWLEAMPLSSASTSPLSPPIWNESNALQWYLEKSEQDNKENKISEKSEKEFSNGKVRVVDTDHNELKFSRNDKTMNNNGLTLSGNPSVAVQPNDDTDELEKFNDIVIKRDILVEKLKNENIVQEKRIQELLRENEKLRRTHSDSRHDMRSIKLREKINNELKLSKTSSNKSIPL